MDKFFGRNEELNKINNFLNLDGTAAMLIYGRRRIGKTALILNAIKDRSNYIFFQCRRNSKEENLNELSKIISKALNLEATIFFHSIEDMLSFLIPKNIILILDEYPYLREAIDGLDSILQAHLDLNALTSNSNFKLILSGSSIDIMKKVMAADQPLYGRFKEVINLKEQSYLESSLYYPNYSNEDKLMIYSALGGEPFLNSKIDTSLSPLDNLLKLAVSKDSYLELLINDIIKSEFTKIDSLLNVLVNISIGNEKMSDIASKSKISSQLCLNILNNLTKLDLIEKQTPINDPNNHKKTFYRLKNNAARFYYKYIDKYLNAREILSPIDFYDEYIKGDFETKFIPMVFENISKAFLINQNKNRKISPLFFNIGSLWYDNPKERVNGQFDLVTEDKLGYTIYEVKYIDKVLGEGILNEELTQLDRCNIKYNKLGFISKLGSTLDSNKYNLYTLDDIYKG